MVCYMGCTARELIDEPAVDIAKTQLSSSCQSAEVVVVLQEPCPFARRHQWIERQAGTFSNQICMCGKVRAQVLATPALPADGIGRRLASIPVPGQSCLPLIGDGDALDRSGACICYALPDNVHN